MDTTPATHRGMAIQMNLHHVSHMSVRLILHDKLAPAHIDRACSTWHAEQQAGSYTSM